jgi:hypothetical protein
MDNAQLQQLLQVIRVGGGGHKTSKFSSAEGTEWRIWRRNFEQTIQINAWPNERCQRKAAAAMESNVSNEAASQSILAHEAGSGGKGNVASIIHLEDEGALVLDVAATTIKSLLVPSPVPTNIATVTNLEAEAGREGAEAVADEEEDKEEE